MGSEIVMGTGAEANSPDVSQPFDGEELLDRFEESWQQGNPPQIEQFLPLLGNPSRRPLLEELICIDLDYRWRDLMQQPGDGSCQRPALQDYLDRFPELGGPEELAISLIGSEYRIRKHWGDRPSHEEYRACFPGHGTRLVRQLAEIDAELAADVAPGSAVPLALPVPDSTGLPAGQPIGDVAALLGLLGQIDVLTAEQRSELSGFQNRFPEPRALAKELMERGWLTPYQANQLFLGRGAELVLASYIVLERLGEGGTGVVFKARQERLNRVVALKVIRRELLADPEVVNRFYREIRLVSQLTSPHVVHAYDAGPVGPTHFLTMEYLEGTDLRRLVKTSGPLPVTQAIDCIRQAALGLQHIHENRLVHRDIKPSNLFLCTAQAGGTIKILDLGLGRWRPAGTQPVAGGQGEGNSSTSLTPAGSVMVGTPDYLAPEQALDFHAADIRADIYSLGCSFYYLLTGRPPFPGGTLTQKLLMHQQAQAPPLEQFRTDLPRGLNAVVGRMMAKRPEERYQTPGQLAAILSESVDTLAERNGSHPAVGTASPLQVRGRKRHSWRPVILGGVILLIALAVFGYLLRSGWQDRQVAETSGPIAPPPVTAAKSKPVSLWAGATETPQEAADNDTKPVELGVKFRAAVDGQVMGIRFYKTPKNIGPHSGSLWTRDGRRLASAASASETASGWQQVDFARPVTIVANTTYIASYHCESRFYAHNRSYFARGIKNGPLEALADGADGPNGVFKYNAISSFPDGSYDASNYWVDVTFTPGR
jgi:serine/threonine-protein kinase